MASSHSPAHLPGSTGTQLLDHPWPPAHGGAYGEARDETAPPADSNRHRMPRQTRGTGPLLGVTAVAATLGATGFASATPAAAPAVISPDETTVLSADPGLALAARIQLQADSQRTAAEEGARLQAAKEAEAKRATQQQEAQKAAAAAEKAKLAAIQLPVRDYFLSAHYGQSASYWSHLHTGLDFAASTGTPVYSVGSGTITSAGWSGSYGYRIIQTLPDGTEIWYCHLSSIIKASGKVVPGQQIGKVGATGNVTGPHLHLEVRPDGGAPVDPESWLEQRGLTP
ncbi:M23 family metallopeptidase [Kitasatospora sp. NBC_00240]|uniref:M23 family metallopeptidase n=1 Tax=Kitasatospora sp. NBC_00240 TaxID=2903567 RepID=UPI002252C52F|nr:M23 family metallopeptidase [Kitasatospora sp. NBC_00240]MCX5211418.1 M23 family metallopeptidase [Kitasatospora sp. NBC_00240]